MKRCLAWFLVVGLSLFSVGAATPEEGGMKEVVIVNGEAGMNLVSLEAIMQSDLRGVAVVAPTVSDMVEGLEVTGYEVRGQILYATINSDLLDNGAVAFRSEHRSNCSDNSIFHVERSPMLANQLPVDSIKSMLVAWTRGEHNTTDAPVRVINVTDEETYTKYDVQLNL